MRTESADRGRASLSRALARRVIVEPSLCVVVRGLASLFFWVFCLTAQAQPLPPGIGCNNVKGPPISISSPSSGQVLAPSTTSVTVSSTATATYSSITYNGDGKSIGGGAPPKSVTWSGLARGSHTVSASTSGTEAGCPISATAPTISFTIANSTPSVTLSTSGASTAPATIAMSASVSNAYAIASVSYLANGTVVGTATSAPYSFSWSGSTQGNTTGVAPGTYSIQAQATDIYGEVGTSAIQNVTVGPAATPAVTLSATASRAMLPAILSLSTTTNDPYTISSLSFIVNGVSYPVAAGPSGSLSLAVPLSGGSATTNTIYSIQAHATDYWGGVGTSSTVTLNEVAHTPPTATVVSAESTWLDTGDPEQIAVEASASDVDGVSSVALILNGSTVQTLTKAPYNFLISGSGYTAGTYSAAVQATNLIGQQTMSSPQSVTVAGAPPVTGDSKTQTRTVKFEYDPNTGRVIKKMTEPEDSNLCLVQTFTYDSFGNLHTATTRNCNSTLDSAEAPAPTGLAAITQRSTTITAEATGTFPQTVTNALNQSVSTAYDPRFGTLLVEKDLNNLATQQTPDAFGRVTLITAPDLTQTKIQYLYCSGVNGGSTTCPGNAVSATQMTPFASDGVTQIGPWKMTFYDVLGRVIETQAQGFNGTVVVQDTTYDGLGRVQQVSHPYFAGSTPVYTTNTYDAFDRIFTSTDPNNGQTSYSYNGLVTSRTNANGQTRTKMMNGQHLVVAVIDATDQEMSYEYDPFGNLIRITDSGGITKSYLYDLRGRKTQTADPDMGTWKYVYDSLGELVQQTDAKSQVSNMYYDLLGRLTMHVEVGLTSNWEYDKARSECTTAAGAAVGQVDGIWTTVGAPYSRIECYDSLERPVQERTLIGARTFVSAMSYDAYGRLASQTYPAGFVYPTGFAVSYGYNAYGYLSQILNASNGTVIWQANAVDAIGRITSDSMAGGTFTDTRIYDVLDRLKSVQVGSGNTIQNDGYWYDAVGNLNERTWIDSSDVTHAEYFGYDGLNRLTTVTGPADKSFSYDSAGNLTYKSDVGSYNYTPGTHQISSMVGTVNGVVNPSFTYDGNGNIAAEAGLAATWTSFNMPNTLTRGASSSAFVYGTEHQRVEQIATSTSGTITSYYVGSSFEQVATSATGVTENHYYVSAYGRRIAMLVDSSAGTGSWRYFHQDQLSTVEAVTDQTGALVERLSYDAWGKRRNLDGTDSATNMVAIDKRGYTDQEELDSIGLVDMNARIYDPAIARFVSPDPTIQQVYNQQSHNRYAYVLNRPLRLVDPTGFTFYLCGGCEPGGPSGATVVGAGAPSFWQNGQGTVFACSTDGRGTKSKWNSICWWTVPANRYRAR